MPQQPPTDIVPDISHFGGRYNQTFKTRKFFENFRVVEVAEASEAVEADEVNETAEVSKVSKSLLRTSKSSRFLNSASF